MSKDLELVKIPLSGILVMLVTIVVKFFVRLFTWFAPCWLLLVGLLFIRFSGRCGLEVGIQRAPRSKVSSQYLRPIPMLEVVD